MIIHVCNPLKQIAVILTTIGLTAYLGCTSEIYANPQGGSVAAGSATISSPATNQLQIQQNSDKAVINWQSYNINSQEHVHYQQPNAASISLNRINPSQGVSNIQGKLTANGQVWLINPAGIWFGPGSYVNVSGLIATTANITDQDFMSGHYHFVQSPDWHGSVVNEGTIEIMNAGLAALVAPGVVNNGYIEANLGSVILASGQEYTVEFSGNQLVNFAVEKEMLEPGMDNEGKPLTTAVRNSGKIVANGGKVLMEARTAGKILDQAINMDGVVEAKSVAINNGEIVLMGEGSNVHVSGELNASGRNPSEKGGSVKVLGPRVIVSKSANIDVSGAAGGGEILIGGDYMGKNPDIANAEKTYVGKDVVLRADALTKGNGGKVIVWADNTTLFYGNIFARGSKEGKGGFVETSGKEFLEVVGANVDASALSGQPGTWLLDPHNVTISGLTSGGGFTGGNPDIFIPIADSATVAASTISSTLDLGTSVTITTGSTGTQPGNITVNSSISKNPMIANTSTLTLDAAGDITVNNTISSLNGILNVVFNAGDDVIVSSAITTNGGSFSNISDVLTINSNINTNSGNFTNSSNTLALNSTINTGGGNFLSTTQNATTLGNAAGTTPGIVNVGAGTVKFEVNADGAGANNYVMNLNSAITSTNPTSNAVAINVNQAAGTGTATVREITTGSGGTITIATDTGGNTAAADILYGGTGFLDAGTVTLSTAKATGANIATAASPLQIKAATLNATTGSSGIFVTNTGTSPFSVNTLQAVNASNTATGVATITSNTAISQGSNPINVTTLSLKTLNDLGAGIGFSNSMNRATTINLQTRDLADTSNAAGVITYVDTDGVAISGINTASNLDLTVGGNITQTGPLTIGGLTNITLNTASTDINLATQANNLASTLVILNPSNLHDFSLRNIASNAVIPSLPMNGLNNLLLHFDTAAITLPTMNLTGTLTLTAANAITQLPSTAVTGTTITAKTLNDVGAEITLSNANNNFATVNLQSRNAADTQDASGIITYDDLSGFNITGIRTLSNALITAGGAITDSGTGTIVGGTTTFATGTNAITLNTAVNDFNNVVIDNAGATTLVDSNAINMGASTITGAFSLTTDGAITQTAPILVTGTTTLTAGSANDITFNLDNDFNTIRAVSANDFTVKDVNALVLGTSSITGTLNINAGGNISESGALLVSGPSTFTVSTAGSNILLHTDANNFAITPVFVGSILDLGLRNINASAQIPSLPLNLRNLTFAFDNAGMFLPGINVTGTLTLTAGNAIAQSNLNAITGTSLIAETQNNSGANLIFDNPNNDFSSVSLQSRNTADNADAGGDVEYHDVNGFDITTLRTTGNASIFAAGDVTDTGVSIIGGTMTYALGPTHNLTVNTNTNNFNIVKVTSANAVILRDTNSLILGESTIGGALSVTTAGALTQNGKISAENAATTLTVGNANSITLNNIENNFHALAITSADNVNVVDANNLILGTSNVLGAYAITVGGTLSQTGVLTITGLPTFTTTVANSDVLLASAANSFLITPVFVNNGNIRNLALRNIRSDASLPTIPTGLNDLTITFNAAPITLPTLSLSGDLTVTAGGAITQSTPSSTQLSVAGTTTLQAGTTNDITLDHTNNDFANVGITSGHHVTLNDTNGLVFNASNISGNLNVEANGSISQMGNFVVSGDATFSAGMNHNITLDLANNNFNVVRITSANNAILRDLNAINLAESNVANDLNVTANSITQSGALTGNRFIAKTLNNAGGAITLNTLANNFNTIDLRSRNATDTANDTGTLAYKDSDGFDIEAIATANAGVNALNLVANGNMTDSGPIVVAGTTTLVAGNTYNIAFDQANNNFGTVSIGSANAVTLVDLNSLILGSIIVDSLDITAGGTITDSGSISVANLASFNTSLASNITLNGTANDFNNVLVTAANDITLVDVNALNLVGLTAADDTTLTVGGALSDSGTLIVPGTLSIIANTNDVNLNSLNNNFGTVGLTNAHDASLVDIDNIILAASNLSGSLTVHAGGAVTDGGSLNIANALTITAVGGITLNNANSIHTFNPSNSGGGGITLVNNVPLTISGFSQQGGGTVNITNAALLSILDGVSLNTGGSILNITAQDLNLNSTGMLNSGNSNISITQNTNGGTIGLGNTSGTMTISGNELERIFANNLILNADSDGQINVDGIQLSNNQNILGTVTLNAISGSLGKVNFIANPSTFKTLSANADNGISVAADISTMTGNLTLNADENGANNGNDELILSSVMLSAFNNLTLSAENGGIHLISGPVYLKANNITVNSTLDGAQNLSLEGGQINFNANVGYTVRIPLMQVVNASNLSSNFLINVDSYLQSTGSGLTNFAGGLNALGAANITTNRLIGNIAVKSLTINLSTGNFFGTVDNQTGANAIKLFTIQNTLVPNTIFFDGIDIYSVLHPTPTPTPIPPIPPVPPIHTVTAGEQLVFPTLFQSPSSSFYSLKPTTAEILLQGEQAQKNLPILRSGCVSVTPYIDICSN